MKKANNEKKLLVNLAENVKKMTPDKQAEFLRALEMASAIISFRETEKTIK